MLKYISTLVLCISLTACLLEDNDQDSPALAISSEEIAVSGGQIQSADNRLTLNFPDGALAANTEITIRQLTDEEITEKYPDLGDIDFVYELGPDGYTFLQPIEVSYLLPSGADITQPRAFVSVSGGILESLSDVVYNPETGEITGSLSHFSDVLAVPLSVSFEYPTTLLHIVNSGSLDLTATGSFDPSIPHGVDSIGGDLNFTPITLSGTDRYITIDDFLAYRPLDQNEPDYGTGTGTVLFSCNEAGQDAIKFRMAWEDDDIGSSDFNIAVITGSVELKTEVTCLATVSPPEEEPPITALTSVVFEAGEAPEAIKKAGSPPYAFNPDDTLQRFLVSGTNLLTIVNLAGIIVDTFELFAQTYGTMYLQHSTGGDFYFAYGPNGRALCPTEAGVFCELEIPTNANTTSAEYGVDANGNEVFNEVYRVRGGQVLFTQEQDQFWQEENLFDNEILNPANGLTFNATVAVFAYEPLTPSTGIAITENGRGYFIDQNIPEVTLFSSDLGDGLRDIECGQFSPGEYGCAVQSFTDATITACAGSSGDDFSCSAAIPAGDGVSLGIRINIAGNLLVFGGDFTDSSIHVAEVTPSLGIELALEIPIATWGQTIDDFSYDFGLLAHVAVDGPNDAILLSSNESDSAAIIAETRLHQIMFELGNDVWNP